jgi:hypothetical protein
MATAPAPQGPTPEQILANMEAEIAAEEAKRVAAEQAREDAAQSIEARMLETRLRLDAARAAREAAERETDDEKAWLDARAKYGTRCGRVYVGRWLILKYNTAREWEGIQESAATVARAALEAGDDARASSDSVKAYQRGILTKSLVHPSMADAQKVLDEHPAAWPELYAMRDELNRGPREAAGKGGAR